MSLYFIAVVPDRELRRKARIFSKDFAERFNSVESFKKFPHLTIINPFEREESEEEVLVSDFSEMTLKSPSFKVCLKNFGDFKNINKPVIFIDVVNKEELLQLYEEICTNIEIRGHKKPDPHLTVAYRDLTPENFQKAWQEYETKTFEDSFLVDKVCLFKHDYKKWNLLKIKYLE